MPQEIHASTHALGMSLPPPPKVAPMEGVPTFSLPSQPSAFRVFGVRLGSAHNLTLPQVVNQVRAPGMMEEGA